MMKNVEEPSANLHLPFTRRLGVSEKKIAGRAVAIALGIICIVLAATLVGAFAYYVPLTNEKDNKISSLNSLVSQLTANATNLQNQLDALNLNLTNLQNQLSSDNSTITSLSSNVTELQENLGTIQNWSMSIQDMVMSNISDWVNKTVILEGKFSMFALPVFVHSPYYSELKSNNLTIGVSYLSLNSDFASFWNEVENGTGLVKIYGVVEKGEVTYTGGIEPPEVVYYVDAKAAEPL
jgi:hypothetical protein